ncbi:type IV secretion system DNA-binding domain-containing protein [Patescibacteria group bacterium]|nr:type IV secretion system DNA-binding domain-containing protein [Patescibacteria group bacterium]
MEENTKEKITILAQTNFRNESRRFGIKKDDRRRHVYCIGKTGMGKSTVLENMIIQDIRNGEGCAIVDPHGDLAEMILNYIPAERINDVIYFNPSDYEYPIAFNVMEAATEEQKHLISSGLIAVFKKLWADSWGPRLEYLLRNSILALLDYPGSTLLGVTRMLVDKTYRNKVIEKIKDPVVKAFWINEYSKYSNQFQVEAISPIQNKVGQFLSMAMIRNIVGQVKSTIDLRDIMDNKKILIMNLAKGRLGEDASALLGAMMITKIQLAAMSRVDIKEETRKDFYLYVDEFQNFATQSFANILSEARKYRLNLIIAHQYVEQLEEEVRAAVFGNVGTLMLFRIGAADAEFLVQEFSPHFTEDDLVNLSKFNVYMKLMIDGVSSSPFSATTIPPLFQQEPEAQSNLEKIIKVSRERYAKSREEIEDKIARWSGMTKEQLEVKEDSNQSKSGERKSGEQNIKKFKKKEEKKYSVNCYECGKKAEINFIPDGIRPVYCDDCFRKIRSGEIPESVEPVKSEPKLPEISLEQVMDKKPQSFNQKPANQNKKETNTPVRNNNHSTAEVKPGQTVKF